MKGALVVVALTSCSVGQTSWSAAGDEPPPLRRETTTLCFPYAGGPAVCAKGDATLECVRGGAGCDPHGDVVGELPVVDPSSSEPGYLELSTLTFMTATEARAPTRPYLEGRMTERGFVPTSRTVHR